MSTTERMSSVSLLDLHRRVEDKELVLPPHQRKKVWLLAKQLKWFKSIQQASKGNGNINCVITTHRIKGTTSPIRYLNDGAQRIYFTLPEFKEHFKSQKEFEDFLRRVYVIEVQVTYEDVAEAIEDYINLNMGTLQTPFELTKCVFVNNLSDYETVWTPVFEELDQIVDTRLNTLGCKSEKNLGREMKHKRFRDNLGLLYRYLERDTNKNNYKIASSLIKEWDSDTKIENNLSNLFAKKGVKWAKNQLSLFEKELTKLSAFYKQIWDELEPKETAPSNVQVRWWLQAMFILNNKKIKTNHKRQFTEELIKATHGKTTVYYKTGKDQKSCNLAMSNLTSLSTILVKGLKLNLEDFESPSETRTSSKANLIPGFANSHIEAFCANGNGETLPENALENGSRSARDMTAKEKTRLSSLNTTRKKFSAEAKKI